MASHTDKQTKFSHISLRKLNIFCCLHWYEWGPPRLHPTSCHWRFSLKMRSRWPEVCQHKVNITAVSCAARLSCVSLFLVSTNTPGPPVQADILIKEHPFNTTLTDFKWSIGGSGIFSHLAAALFTSPLAQKAESSSLFCLLTSSVTSPEMYLWCLCSL